MFEDDYRITFEQWQALRAWYARGCPPQPLYDPHGFMAAFWSLLMCIATNEEANKACIKPRGKPDV